MLISYDNLITRLWMSGAILPYAPGGIACPPEDDILDENEYCNVETPSSPTKTETLCNEKGLPPIPHPWWISRLGFQQDDPVTDFRSGGVLSLAMLLHIVESCPEVHRRFLDQGDTHVLPYAITSINVTDMLAKILMFKKSVDKIDALLSSKPFWRMFSDPNALLTMQELSLDILCDVVCELRREYAEEEEKKVCQASLRFLLVSMCYIVIHHSFVFVTQDVTVFDFHVIMERTEKRVQNDLLGAGPKTVEELKSIYQRMREKYIAKMERQEKLANKRLLQKAATSESSGYSLNPLKISNAFFSKKPPTPVDEEEIKQDLHSDSHADNLGGSSNFTISEDDDQDDNEWLKDPEHFAKPKDLLG